jgi:hypothetical protein
VAHWRHFAFVTDLDGDAVDVDAFHRSHANVELAIRDLKEVPDSSMRPRGSSSPTRPGWCVPHWRTTSSAGRPCSVTSHHGTSAPGPHRSHSVLLRSRPPGQPLGHPDITYSSSMVLGRVLLARPHPLAQPASGPRVGRYLADGTPHTTASGADNLVDRPKPSRHPEHHRPRPAMSGGVISCRQILTANAAVVLTLSAGQQS